VPQIAILVSCIGRKLVMNQRVEEEIEQVQKSSVVKWLPDFILMEKWFNGKVLVNFIIKQ
jgi:hypothetical protein